MKNDPDINSKVKMIGIGANDDIDYIDYFAKKFKAEYPLFPDEDLTVHEQVGGPATPYWIGVRLNDDGTNDIFYSMLGEVKEPDKFLDTILTESGLK